MGHHGGTWKDWPRKDGSFNDDLQDYRYDRPNSNPFDIPELTKPNGQKDRIMTQNNNPNIPQHLIDSFCKLADDFEMHIRADERDRIISKMRGTLFAAQASKPVQEIEVKSSSYNDAVALARKAGLCETHRRLVGYLSQGTFMAVPTIAGHLNIKKASVYTYLSGLKKAGYDIEIRSTGNRRGGYVNIYRLAKVA